MRLESLSPDVLALTETWLDEAIEDIDVPGYRMVARRDRTDGRKGGGVALFCKREVRSVVHIHTSGDAERIWCLLHGDLGPVRIGVWYRAPDAAPAEISTLIDELSDTSSGVTGTILLGDMNIHHSSWLRFSSGCSAEGQALRNICDDAGLLQKVREPTRNQYLLDLVLTDLSDTLRVEVLPAITDHKLVMCRLRIATPIYHAVTRYVWDYKQARWDGLIQAFANSDWQYLASGSVDTAVETFTRHVLNTSRAFIPYRRLRERKSTHPWITPACEAAVRKKIAAEGCPHYEDECRRCSAVLSAAYTHYMRRVRDRLANLPRGSKAWWKWNRVLLNKSRKTACVPPLRTNAGQWVLDAKGKADLFAQTFASKSMLPSGPAGDVIGEPDQHVSCFLVSRLRWTARILKDIREDSATGPDGLPGRILKRCYSVLGVPITKLARRMLHEGVWPRAWRVHWLVPLYKHGSVHNAGKYRGIHLTTVLSKTVERVIGMQLVSFFRRSNAYGSSQWAYRPGHSCRDLVTLLVAKWILAFHAALKVCIFLSDISGAFDRVSVEILLKKCRRAGVSSVMLSFLESFLAPRTASVIVDGEMSAPFALEDTVFQGTVFGPPLWNTFFADESEVTATTGTYESKFADDLNHFRVFPCSVDNDAIIAEMTTWQAAVHQWGSANRVEFDASKERFVILHKRHGQGDDFRLLGSWIDVCLSMGPNISKIIARARPKVTALLRTRPFYTTTGMITQYKAHVLCILELNTGSFYHATTSVLEPLDNVQESFIRQLGLTRCQAFLDHNLAPLCVRRDIAMLGLIFRSVSGQAHTDLAALFGPAPPTEHYHRTRRAANQHDRQLQEERPGSHPALMQRSVFGLIRVWNRLPHHVVHSTCVSAFQVSLTELVRERCRAQDGNWHLRLSPRRFIP